MCPNPPPKAPPAPAASVRRRINTDEFQVAAPRKSTLEFSGPNTDMAQTVAGVLRRFANLGEVPPDITIELNRLLASGAAMNPLADEWLRVVLSPPFPVGGEDLAREAKRISDTVTNPIARLPASQQKVLSRLRGLGVSTGHLFRASHLLVEGGAKLYQDWVDLGARPAPCDVYPSPGRPPHAFDIGGMGLLRFGVNGTASWVQFEAHVDALRAAAPKSWAFFVDKSVKGQNIGPMGCSPRTAASGNPVRVRYHA